MSAQTRCPNCGALNPESAEWCGQCMQPLGGITPGLPPSPSPPPPDPGAPVQAADHGWVPLVYYYLAAFFGLVIAVIALIFVFNFALSGLGEPAGRAVLVGIVGAAVWFVHLSAASQRLRLTHAPATRPVAASGSINQSRAHWSLLLYLRIAALLGLMLLVFGGIGVLNALIDAATFDRPGIPSFGSPTATFPTFAFDRGDILINGLKALVSAAVGFLLMRVHLNEADKRS